MRMIGAASLVAMCGMLAVRAGAGRYGAAVQGQRHRRHHRLFADGQTDIRSLAIDHCASYGKVVKFLAVEPHEGGYISFACRWVPYGAMRQPLRAATEPDRFVCRID